MPPSSSSLVDYFSGALAGTANITAGYPFDSVKVRLQTSPGSYRGAWRCFRHIIQNEGVVRGLYRGMSAPVTGGAIETGVNYAVYRAALKHLQADLQAPELHHVAVAAGTAGFALSFILSPFELIKCRMQTGAAAGYASTGQCIRQTVRQEGWMALTRGLGGTLARETPGNAIFFSVYEALRRLHAPNRPSADDQAWLAHAADLLAVIAAGGSAGVVMWAAVLPIDAAKSRIQTALPGSRYDMSMLGNLCQMYREGGLKVMYAGLTPSLVRAFPANAAQWLAWDLLTRGTGA